MSLSESPNLGQSRVLDEVRAKIFYLASDVEPASQPAAALLRAVAESIVDGSDPDTADLADRFSERATVRSMAAAIGYPVSLRERLVEADSSGQKR